jgi:hypothetical protein
MKTTLWLGVGVLLILSTEASFAQSARTLEDADAYAIYSMLLKKQGPVVAGKMKRLLLAAETPVNGSDDLDRCLAAEGSVDPAVVSLVRTFQAENKHSWQFERKFDLPIPYELIKQETFRSFFKDINAPGWSNFFKAYPDSGYFFGVSVITFDPKKTRALVYVGYGCGFTCGKASYHLVEKREGKWTEVPFLLSSYSCGVVS